MKINTANRNRTWYILIGILVIFLLFSGCTTPSPRVSNQSLTPVATESLVLYTEEQPPMNYIDENGDVAGRSTAIVREIMKRQNINAPIHLTNWTTGYNVVLTTPNTAIFSTTLTHQRDSMFKWVGPIATVEYSFFGRDDFPTQISSVSDVRKAGLVAVVGNTGRHQTLQSSGVTNLLLCEDDEACVEALLEGKAALWFGTKDMYAQNAKKLSSDMNRIKEVWPFISRGSYIAFNRNVPDSEIEKWQDALDEMKEDGTFEVIVERYMPYICSWVKCTP
ncbi:MAG: transporter substrate-binding domain-containing protein [Methanospirillum sp.]|nr:transporter substrate-binding domain-containing protein [Methanospirillum sp.]